MAGCASKPPSDLQAVKTAYGPVAEKQPVAGRDQVEEASAFSAFGTARPGSRGGALAGRTLSVASMSEIRLRDKEVILTFDDGPIPAKTNRVLDILRQHGVKATFLMVGQMAGSYPATAARVVREGHSVGGHTYNHANLASLGVTRALSDIDTGNAAVARATGVRVGFFRFPYLADSAALRREVTDRGLVILDVDIDSKDYFTSTPATISGRIMSQLRAKRKGIILMHDIHGRTASMLPLLLAELKAGGYKVVALQHRRSRMPEALVSAAKAAPGARRM